MPTFEQLQGLVRTALSDIAPECADITLANDRPLRRQLELDSIDWLNFLLLLHQRTGVDIPEADYPQLLSIDAIAEYLKDRMT